MEISSAQQQALASNYINSQAMESGDENQERRILVKPRQPADEQALQCPRCESTNTKFCYYNNYSLSQPRYFCKGCRRYWTQGGSLRNVPFGGGCRKNNKRSSSNSSSSSIKKPQDHQALIATDPPLNPLFPNINLPPFPCPDPSDHLTLALSWLQNPDHDHAPHNDNFPLGSLNPNPNNGTGFLDILKSGILDPASYPTNGLLFNNGACGYNIGIAFDHVGLSTSSATTSTYEAAQGQFGNNYGGNKKDNGVVDVNSSRGYRINGSAGNTNYVINSSLM